MNPKTFRNHISQQCGFNKAKQGVWDEKSKTFIKPSGTVQQGRRPMFQPFERDGERSRPQIEQSTAESSTQPVQFHYALQVCNAGAMPDHLPESFEDWIKQGNDAIDLDRTEATCKWFDELPKQLPF